MPIDFYSFGTPCEPEDALCNQYAQRTSSTIELTPYFEIIEYRKHGDASVVIVDCLNSNVPSRNPYSVKNRERLALAFCRNKLPEVRALRKDFPVGLHQNSINEGEPVSLCLYEEPWSSTIRFWTPQNHLARILWWLEGFSKGTLHHESQALEPLYFSRGKRVVLPPNFTGTTDKDNPLTFFSSEKAILALWEKDAESFPNHVENEFIPLLTTLPPIRHSKIERLPATLGTLVGQLSNKDINYLELLKTRIKESVTHEGISVTDHQKVLLLICIQLLREEDGKPEEMQYIAFLTDETLGSLGDKLGALFTVDAKKYFIYESLSPDTEEHVEWKGIPIEPLDVRFAPDIKFARKASAVDANSADFNGTLLGVGSLGGTLAELWSKEGWGNWTYIDPDFVEPHNIARHVSKYFHIGLHKVDAVAHCTANNYYPNQRTSKSIPDSALNCKNPDVKHSLESADLIIDASTTLEVPRELAISDDPKRCASAFFTPSGFGAVLLIEDKNRQVRLDALEAQYYRAILNSDWGENHLDKHRGDLWAGCGCRDASAVIPTELVQLHSAVLGRQIRKARELEDGLIQVFHFRDETAEVTSSTLNPYDVVEFTVDKWTVVLDAGSVAKLIELRSAKLPVETGGILLGYIDHKSCRIYIVDVLGAPADSEETETSFIRGTEGLSKKLAEAKKRTAGIVTYIGEWHSHPEGCQTTPSGFDQTLLQYLTEQLATEGHPALMAIAGEKDISFILQSGVQ